MSLKGTAPANKGQRSTNCKCGLLRTPENTNSSGYCKVCCNAAQRRFRKNHPDAKHYKHYQIRYGVTPEQFIAEMNKQEGRCKICKALLSHDSKETTPTLDHMHDASKKFRGVLCHLCNTGLGLFRENVEILQSAIQYLKETQ